MPDWPSIGRMLDGTDVVVTFWTNRNSRVTMHGKVDKSKGPGQWQIRWKENPQYKSLTYGLKLLREDEEVNDHE